MQGRPAHLRRRARVRGLAPDFVCNMTKQRAKSNKSLWVLLGGALLLRLVLALVTDGYPYDMSCFVAWGDKLAAEGPAAFYSEGYFADYPPGYIWVLGLVGAIRAALHIAYESKWTYFLLALVPSLCDCGLAWLVYRAAKRSSRGVKEHTALVLTAFTAFNPLMLFDTGVWKQIDGAFALPLVLCFVLLEQRRYLPAAVLYGVALAIKPQALLFGPVLAVCYLAAITLEKDRLRAFGRCFGGAALALLPPLLTGLPFFGVVQLIPKLIDKYTGTMSGYPYATINAFNWLAALGGNWKGQADPALFGISWQQLGCLNILLVTAGLAYFAVRSVRFSPLLLAAYYGIGIFTLAHCMHERYMVPGVLLTLLAAAHWNDIRLYAAGVGLSLTGFINLAAVYSLTGTNDEWLTSATSSTVAVLTGLGETVCFVLLIFAVWDIARHGHTLALPETKPETAPPVPAPQPKWTRREVGALLALTAATAVLSFSYLGGRTAPQDPLDATGTALSESVTLDGSAVSLWVYPGISFGGSMTVTDANGSTVFEKELNYGTCFSWTANDVQLAAGTQLTVMVENAQLFELAFRDANGRLVPVTGGGALFDEQTAVPDTISQLNSMYFDEIYHGRTGYEQLHKMPVYETTHPPLGKDLIMVGIAMFGMTAFGWRFAGTLFGVLLVPLAWCFVRRLTRKPWAAATAGVLLALDFMRFSQSRLATIDIYGTFFILLGAYCMVWYCQRVLTVGVNRALLPMALGGVAFGLGCAAKWTGIYAGAGLAVLYLGVLYARWQQKRPGFRAEFRTAAVGGVLFYVLLPLCLYIGSYLPYWWRDPAFSLSDWWQCQVSMFSYHATLKATHPFESRWYTWLLGLRPVWYYRNGYLPYGMKASIAGMAGPVIWLVGLAALVGLLWHQVSGRGSRQGAGVLILYGTQLIPWMLVTRCTFLYHYFPSSMFCLAALALVLARMKHVDWAKKIAACLCVVALVLFVLYYPALSGLPIPAWWADALNALPSFGFY